MEAVKLEEARSNIDRINSRIVSLLIERMEQVDRVAEYKASHDLPVSAPEREKSIIANVSQLAGEEYADDIIPVFRAIFAASCSRENRKMNGRGRL